MNEYSKQELAAAREWKALMFGRRFSPTEYEHELALVIHRHMTVLTVAEAVDALAEIFEDAGTWYTDNQRYNKVTSIIRRTGRTVSNAD